MRKIIVFVTLLIIILTAISCNTDNVNTALWQKVHTGAIESISITNNGDDIWPSANILFKDGIKYENIPIELPHGRTIQKGEICTLYKRKELGAMEYNKYLLVIEKTK